MLHGPPGEDGTFQGFLEISAFLTSGAAFMLARALWTRWLPSAKPAFLWVIKNPINSKNLEVKLSSTSPLG